LRRLGDVPSRRLAAHLCFKYIDLRSGPTNECTIVWVYGTGVRRPRAGAARKALTGLKGKNAVAILVSILWREHGLTLICLVRDGTDITGVIRVRPLVIQAKRGTRTAKGILTYHAFKTCSISGPPKVPHGPKCRPKTHDVICTRESHRRLKNPSSKAELVPRRQKTALIMQVMGLLLR
jgi:hypothetical protein